MTAALFINDQLDQNRFPPPVRSMLMELLGLRLVTRCPQFGPGHMLLVILRQHSDEMHSLMQPVIRPGQSLQTLADGMLELYTEDDAGNPPPPLHRDSFTPAALDLLEELAAATPPVNDLPALLALVCRNLPREEHTLCGYFFDVDRTATGELARRNPQTTTAPQPVFDASGELMPDAFTPAGRGVLDEAMIQAGRSGYDECHLSHLLLAMFQCADPGVQRILRVYGQGSRLQQSRDYLLARIHREYRCPPSPVRKSSFSMGGQLVLDGLANRSEPAGPLALLLQLLTNLDSDPLARDALSGVGLRLDVPAAITALKQSLETTDESRPAPVTADVPPALSDCENLTAKFAADNSAELVMRPECEELERALFSRETRCVLVHGDAGSGRTKLVEAVARRAAKGDIGFLREATFLRTDAALLEPAACDSFLRDVLQSTADSQRIILAVENFQCLAEHAEGQLRQLAAGSAGLRIIGIMSTADHAKFHAADTHLNRVRWNIRLQPVEFDVAVEILQANVPGFEEEFGVRIDRESLVRIAQTADRYLRDLQRPQRGIQLLRWACDEASFQQARQSGAESPLVDFRLAAQVLARRVNVSREQILGEHGAEFYQQALEKRVIGQPEATRALASHILLTRRGARSGERPAGIFLFAGQTGTGKTLMAEAVAAIHSPKGTLHKFTMGDFKAEHSTSGLTGTTAGYVGYGDGGPVVNALLQDPAGVLLFDEAEKAHPSVWDTCLELFATGNIRDGAGRVANARQSLIILTTNLAAEVIQQGVQNHYPHEVIAQQTEAAIRTARHPKTGETWFKAEFLGRIDEIIIFHPLTDQHLAQIARLEIDRKIREHREQSSVMLEPAGGDWNPLAEFLADQCRNDPSNGRAIERRLRNAVSVPLAALPLPESGNLRILVALQSGQIVLQNEHGQPLTMK